VIPSEPFKPDPFFESEPSPECPPVTLPEWQYRIEHIMDDQVVTTRNNGYQHYLVHWQGRPESENSWITREDLQYIDSNLLKQFKVKLTHTR